MENIFNLPTLLILALCVWVVYETVQRLRRFFRRR